MEPFLGCWWYKSHEGFDRFLVHVGAPFLAAKLAVTLPAWLTYSKLENEGEFKLELATLTNKAGGKFRLGEEFDETNMGGKVMKVCGLSLFTSVRSPE